MACDIIATVLRDAELLEKDFGVDCHMLLDLKVVLRLLRTFFLCTGMFNNDLPSNVNLKSFLSSLQSAVIEKVTDLYNHCLSEARFRKLGLNSRLTHVNKGVHLYNRCLMGKSSILGLNFSSNVVKERKKPFGRDNFGGKVYFGTSGWRSEFDAKVTAIRTTCLYDKRQEISESYINLLDNYCLLQNYSCWEQQLLEFIDSLLVNMVDIQTWVRVDDQVLRELIEALKEKVAFLKNFIGFAQWRGFEDRQLEVLFTHLKVVAINAASRVFYMWSVYPYDDKEVRDDKMRLNFSQLLQKIKPAEPQIRDTYIQVLTASNLAGSSHALGREREKHILGDFIDSLLNHVWDALIHSITYMVLLEDQMPILYEGLRFLRSVLKKHLENLPEKVKDLIRAAVKEAGIVICSLLVHELKNCLAKEVNLALSNLLEKIKLIKVVSSAFIFPKTDEIGFVDFFLENLKELPGFKVDSIVFAKDQIQTVVEGLVSLRSLLENILEQRNQHEKLPALCRRVVEVAYKAQFIIQSLVVGDILDPYPMIFNPVTKEINLIKMEALKIGDIERSFAAQKAIGTANPLPPQGSIPAIGKVVLSLDDEANKTIEQLITGLNRLDIISIVGMPGLGKTTLARSVYDDPSVAATFHIRAWCVVSQVYTKKNLVLQILGCIDPKLYDQYSKMTEYELEGKLDQHSKMTENELEDKLDQYSKMTEYELEDKLRKCLLKNKYLIVLDDVWDSEAWSGLERSFPNDDNGSRILLTSRHPNLAKKINPHREPHPLRQLTDDESWELLQRKLPCREGYNVELGRKIATNCRGLPLTVVIVAGILANVGKDGWEEIARRLSLSALSITEQCMGIIELSYRNLPRHLQPCLLYFGAFPKDQEIPFRKLMRLWIAEEFVQTSDQKSLEDVAEDYMNDLIGRSLVMTSKERSIGGVKACRIHDLLHEFCVIKSKKENFLSLLCGYDDLFTFNGQCDQQRLCVHSHHDHFEKSRIVCPSVRSILFFPLVNRYGLMCCRLFFNFCIFKLLKVLDLEEINLGFSFPSETILLVELRFLAAQGKFKSIPSSISNLSNLETLLVKTSDSEVILPETIWNMQKLRHLHGNFSLLSSSLAKDILEMSSDLHNLDTFSLLKLSFGQSIETIMRKLPNIRRLKCRLLASGKSTGDCNKVVATNFLSRLQSLHLLQYEREKYHIEVHFPLNLKKLSLTGFHWSVIPEIKDLPNLEVLKLCSILYEGDSWDMEEEWILPNLKFLKLKSLHIARWTSSGDHFPCLEKLLLQHCRELKEVPSCLKDIPALQMIEVHHCRDSVEGLIGEIEKEQKDWGNVDFKVLIFH